MQVWDAITGRRTIRLYDGEGVSHETLKHLIEAAGEAPSWYNSQPWHFHVATGAMRDAVCEVSALSTVHLQEYLEMLPPDQLASAERFFASLGSAPAVIVVSAPLTDDDLARINNYLAIGAAIQNLMLAAFDEGLGCCNLTSAFWVRDKLATLFDLDAQREIVSMVLVGHPAESPARPSRRADIATYLES
jgi:nitroreductase